ncbi:hypothetical protein DDB_G0276829 [Dictyostelium discoideum AX4]|uniref:Probable serine/threonine-protein kinase ifkB n=1 Tax=Dictyostelium discoideum TaxID=44689 RepID=IFKB_DICDI|nr:hypothetical protein DDB_G0276829 [Dictyostelium discoideum AX4]Q550L8.1 RecName: Full=Probable serine/threonine-protein kinase ifkB; AltName: Full=Initiation factor kinase B [Dictyostelium discoideum]EAL68916.1 hypothetical protein DDB_G0276829 [Dictyostelium discoideum AX4]|eukprot:XP_642914.1 hypothetical protein DDB_G0276829 [Dictyostelium discoideum AX4]
MIGKGGFGVVVKSRNKLDCRYYAIKKIKTKGYTDSNQEPLTNKLLREVTTLSRLHHQFVVRYYQAWIEKSCDSFQSLEEGNEDLSGDLETDASEDWFMQSSINSRSIISRDSYSGLSTSNSNVGGANNTAGGGDSVSNANSNKSMIVGNNNKKLTLSSSNTSSSSSLLSNNKSKILNTSKSTSTNTSTSTSTSNTNKNKKISKKKKSKLSPLMKPKNKKNKNNGESEQSSSDSENGENGMKSRIIENASDSYSDDDNNNNNDSNNNYHSDNESDSFSGSISMSDGNGSGYEATDDEDIINNSGSFDDNENDDDDEEDDDDEYDEEDDDYETFDFQDKSRVVSNNSKLSTSSSRKKPPKETHTLYIQMEYCSKKTLKTLIDNVGGIAEEEAFRLLRQIVEGLNHIHSQQIIHRDLKPANIFIDNEQNVKIGDFGLATSGAPVSKSDDLNSSTSNAANNINLSSSTNSTAQQTPMWDLNDENLSMTGGVGTPFYCCPEILEKNTKHYGTKVDMYSLGIIFFEMCFQFQTQMERSNILRDLRDNLKFPPGFESTKPDQTQIIRSLLSRDPTQRPSTKQLLESGLLPSKMEDDILKEAIKTIANPTISLFSYLMEKLFCLSNDEHIMSRYLYTSNPSLTPMHLICREKTFSRLEKIFLNHGSIRIDTPTLFPKNPTNSTHPGAANVAKFLDESGTVVYLPYDLTIPWARHVVIHNIQQAKRYTFSKVYRRSQPGFSPKELYECDFDIIGPSKSRHISDAETLRIIIEIMEEFKDELFGNNSGSNSGSGSGGSINYKIRINHYGLLDSILSECGVEKRFFTVVYQTVAQLHWRLNWAQVAQSLKEHGLSASIVSNISTYFRQRGELAQCVTQLESLLANHKEATTGISDLKILVRNLQMINIIPRFLLDLSLIHNHQYYEGLVFQAYIERPTLSNPSRTEIIMSGGRYDKLIKSLHPNPSLSNNIVSGVGVTLACEKIVNSVLNYRQHLLNNCFNTTYTRRNKDPPNSNNNPNNNNLNNNVSIFTKFQSHIEVFVCSLGSSLLGEKLQVASQLWSAGIKADYSQTDYYSSEDIYSNCRENGIPWVVILREKAFQIGKLKVKQIETRQERTVARKDLVDFFLKSRKHNVDSKNIIQNTSSSDLSNLIGGINNSGSGGSGGSGGGSSMSSGGGGGGNSNIGGSDHHHHGHHSNQSTSSSGNSNNSNTQQTSPIQHHVHFSNTKSIIGSSGIISNATFSGGSSSSSNIIHFDEPTDSFSTQIVYQGVEEIKKSKIETLVQTSLSKLFRGFIQSKSSTIRVIVTDLAYSVIRDLQISESHDNISKFQRVSKEKLLQLKNQIFKWKVYPFIVIHSIKDDKSVIFNSVV